MMMKHFAALGVGVAGLVTLLGSHTAQAANPAYAFAYPVKGQFYYGLTTNTAATVIEASFETEFNVNGFGQFAYTNVTSVNAAVSSYFIDTEAYCSNVGWVDQFGLSGPFHGANQSLFQFCGSGQGSVLAGYGGVLAYCNGTGAC